MAITKWKRDEKSDPWNDFRSLQKEINDLFDLDHSPSSTGLFDRSVSPPMDVVEKEHEFDITFELPGLEQEDVEISVAANVLTIKGEKKEEKEAGDGKYYRKESWSGSFQRTLSLPATADSEKIDAQLKNGVLNITIPVKPEAKPKQIAVKVN